MRNKFLNLFFRDLILDLKVATILIVALLCLSLQKVTRQKELGLAKLEQDKIVAQELARQIPYLEKKLALLKAEEKIIGALPRKADFILSGIFIKDGKPVALIGENIYQNNDTIDGFKILEITLEHVICEDRVSKQRREVRLPE